MHEAVPTEIFRNVRRIEIRTKHLLNDVFTGQYQSVFKGRGMEFSEVRLYQPGDDIRSIDWNVTARAGEAYVKRYVEERELTVVFLVDASASGRFGSREKMKGELAVELCALLAFSAIRSNDKVGLVLFTDEVETFLPPQKGRRHVLHVIRELLFFRPRGRGTRVAAALEYLRRVIKKKCVVFLVSDFLDSGFETPLRLASRVHDVIPVVVGDARERSLPSAGMLRLVDAETGETLVADTSSRRAREAFARLPARRRDQRRRLFRSLGLDSIEVTTGEDAVRPLLAFFRARERRLR
jgi:uncharacterized protein (DUF58 family)